MGYYKRHENALLCERYFRFTFNHPPLFLSLPTYFEMKMCFVQSVWMEFLYFLLFTYGYFPYNAARALPIQLRISGKCIVSYYSLFFFHAIIYLDQLTGNNSINVLT